MTNTSLDFSMGSVPDSWHDAAVDGPEMDYSPLNSAKKKRLRVAPSLEQVDMVTASIAAIAMSFVGGVLWFALETRGHVDSPWLAVALGALVAAAIRLGGGRANPEMRATLAVVFYLVTLLVSIYFVERFDYILTYGSAPGLNATENAFVRDRFTDPETVLAWVAGLVVAIQVSYMTRRRT